MTVQRPIAAKEAPDYEFRRQHSLHKVWVALKDSTSKTHYPKDCSATLQQLQWKKVAHLVFSYQVSMDDCLRLEKFFKGKYRTIQIYRRGADGRFPKEPIIKFVSGKMVQSTDDSLPADIHFRVLYNEPEKGQPHDFQLEKVAKLPVVTPVAPAPVVPAPQTPAEKQNAAFISSRRDTIAANWKFL